jgi:Tfp pilus assembly protein FimT
MTTLEEVLVVLAVVAIVLLAVALRLRKLRRDEMRKIAARVERHLVCRRPRPTRPPRAFACWTDR